MQLGASRLHPTGPGAGSAAVPPGDPGVRLLQPDQLYVEVPIPSQIKNALSVLQTQSPPMPFSRLCEVVCSDLGDKGAPLLAGMDRIPVSAASIGQVHRARLPDGRLVAVKVRYPDIDRAIAADFRQAALGGRIAALVYPGARVEPMIQEARARLLDECDYAREARMQTRFAELFRAHPTIVVPQVDPELSSRRVLTTAWVDGRGFGRVAPAPEIVTWLTTARPFSLPRHPAGRPPTRAAAGRGTGAPLIAARTSTWRTSPSRPRARPRRQTCASRKGKEAAPEKSSAASALGRDWLSPGRGWPLGVARGGAA